MTGLIRNSSYIPRTGNGCSPLPPFLCFSPKTNNSHLILSTWANLSSPLSVRNISATAHVQRRLQQYVNELLSCNNYILLLGILMNIMPHCLFSFFLWTYEMCIRDSRNTIHGTYKISICNRDLDTGDMASKSKNLLITMTLVCTNDLILTHGNWNVMRRLKGTKLKSLELIVHSVVLNITRYRWV